VRPRVGCLADVLCGLQDGDSSQQRAMWYPGYLFREFLPADQEASSALKFSRGRSVSMFSNIYSFSLPQHH